MQKLFVMAKYIRAIVYRMLKSLFGIKTVTRIFLLSIVALVGVSAQEQINVAKVLGSVDKIGPESRAWISSEYQDIILYPHATTQEGETNRDANLTTKKIRVKALYGGKNIVFLLAWKDITKNIQYNCCSIDKADGFALQFPIDYSDITKLPYIRMGNQGRSVISYAKKAKEQITQRDVEVSFVNLQEYYDAFNEPSQLQKNRDNGQVFITTGFNSIKKLDQSAMLSVMKYQKGVWKSSLSMPLKTNYLNLDNGAFPISFVVWDGNSSNGIEYISPWTGVKLFGQKDGDEVINALNAEPSGDIEKGKRLAIENCAGCHNFANTRMAPENMAPNLSNVGGYSTLDYLKESITNPNAVLVTNYHSNAQSNFPWYQQNEDGNITSTMPSYDWMDETSIDDIVSFLHSLKPRNRVTKETSYE